MNRPGFDPDGSRGTRHVPLADADELPGRQALLLGALVIGLIMLGIQLWLLTVALELYLSGEGKTIWGLALVSGVLFGGSLLATWLLSRRPTVASRDG